MWAYEGKHKKKSWLIQVPAAAVIPEWLALFGMIGRQGYVGGVKIKFTLFNKDGILYDKNSWVSIKMGGCFR